MTWISGDWTKDNVVTDKLISIREELSRVVGDFSLSEIWAACEMGFYATRNGQVEGRGVSLQLECHNEEWNAIMYNAGHGVKVEGGRKKWEVDLGHVRVS